MWWNKIRWAFEKIFLLTESFLMLFRKWKYSHWIHKLQTKQGEKRLAVHSIWNIFCWQRAFEKVKVFPMLLWILLFGPNLGEISCSNSIMKHPALKWTLLRTIKATTHASTNRIMKVEFAMWNIYWKWKEMEFKNYKWRRHT